MKNWILTMVVGMVIILLLDIILVSTHLAIPGWYNWVIGFAVFGLAGSIVKRYLK